MKTIGETNVYVDKFIFLFEKYFKDKELVYSHTNIKIIYIITYIDTRKINDRTFIKCTLIKNGNETYPNQDSSIEYLIHRLDLFDEINKLYIKEKLNQLINVIS